MSGIIVRLLSLMLVVIAPVHAQNSSQTPNTVFQSISKIVTVDGIDRQQLVTIGGIPQWISIRGRHANNPILLFLHGGPGFTVSPVSYYFLRDWEEYFTVVQWDQRAAGKTYLASDPAVVRPTMSVDRMVADAEEVIEYLRKTYSRDRIVLMSHSFGTVVGIKVAQKHPDWLFAYVGMGQFVEFGRSEKMGYEATLLAAHAEKNEQAIKDLESIAPFPDAQHPERNLQNLGTERRWLATYGGYYWRNGFGHNADVAQFSPDYSAAELHTRDEAQWFSDQALWDEIGRVDLSKLTLFKCPVLIMQGRHDLGTSSILVDEWYKTLRAPAKKLIWFEDSSHMVYEEEPGKVLISLVNDVLPLTTKH